MHEFFKKLSPREKKIFIGTLIVIVFTLLDRLFLGPVLTKLNHVDVGISKQKSSIDRDLRFLSYKDQIIEESSVFDKYFVSEIPEDGVINGEFLGKLEALATKSNVKLVKSNPSQKEKKKKYLEYYANLDCFGPLKDVVAFMHMINSSDDLLKIVKLSISPKRGSATEVNASMSIVKIIISKTMFKQEPSDTASH